MTTQTGVSASRRPRLVGAVRGAATRRKALPAGAREREADRRQAVSTATAMKIFLNIGYRVVLSAVTVVISVSVVVTVSVSVSVWVVVVVVVVVKSLALV